MLIVVYYNLFADAEMLKNIPQHLIRRYISGDLTQIMQAFPNVLWYKLTTKMGIQSGDDSLDS